MKRSIASFALRAVLLSSILFSLTQSSVLWKDDKDEDGDLVDQVCEKTPYYDLCSSTLHSNHPSPNTDVKGLALLLVNDIVATANDTLNYVENLIKHTSDPSLERPLSFCAETYIPVVKYVLPQAADAISKGQFGFASYSISQAEKEVDACDKKFSGSTQSPLGDGNGIIEKLLEVAAAIIKLIK